VAATSSTSNSNSASGRSDAIVMSPAANAAAVPHQHPPTRAGAPWAFLLAIAVVAVFEIFLHTRPRESLIPYTTDLGQYQAVREFIETRGPAEVALVGSSQMREGVVMPRLIEAVSKQAGRPVTVANYATRGARVDGFEAVIDEVLSRPTKPKVIVVGLGVRDLRAQGPDLPRIATFFDLGDWWREYRRAGWRATDVLPQAVRNELGRVVFTLRFRETISTRIKDALGRSLGLQELQYTPEPNPITGGATLQHEGSRGANSLATTKQAMRRLLARAKENYNWSLPAEPTPVMRDRLRLMVTKLDAFCAGGGRVIVIEMPVAAAWRKQLEDAGFHAPFDAAVRAAAEGKAIDYFSAGRIPLTMSDAEFSDLQHHNRAGAEKFSDWLAGVVGAAMK
jgi:hypothetical protein